MVSLNIAVAQGVEADEPPANSNPVSKVRAKATAYGLDSADIPHRTSQEHFCTPGQSIVVFGWDDTLFPTHWLREHNLMHWKRGEHIDGFSRRQLAEVGRLMDSLESHVLAVLKEAVRCAHVVIVTLAPDSWLQSSFQNFPRVGAFIKAENIEIVFAKNIDAQGEDEIMADIDAMHCRAQKHQYAILGAISRFYLKSNSSWKNIISFGDSTLQQYSVQAACLDYATVNDDDSTGCEQPELGTATTKVPVLTANRGKMPLDNFTLSGWVGRHYRRLRCKTVKMFLAPSIRDLILQMTIILRWLPLLVIRDGGLDVDMEDEASVNRTHNELLGRIAEPTASQKRGSRRGRGAYSPRTHQRAFVL